MTVQILVFTVAEDETPSGSRCRCPIRGWSLEARVGMTASGTGRVRRWPRLGDRTSIRTV
ncbi:hypothetical protein [Dactylosporangium fulvum]|uniref:Uncharacterized protein n=1 Tax=Dactylosporangium fulvum TaxID=53359 RepID=A0ABY5VT74_9ACTN|nr:hypothetical protein [Dactylosporangium fulvum]UWP79016.1 hypothetical protein Dfulv_28035 [Dactylosporangium fulvum]